MPNNKIDFLFLHVPKLSNYYKAMDDFMFINFIPMGVFALCDTLNKNGISSRIKHLGLERIKNIEFSIVQWIKENQIKVVGMSLHWHFQSFDVIDVSQKIKNECPDTTIVLGGLTTSRFGTEILENFKSIDAVIVGDADKGILPFANKAKNGDLNFESVPNCIWRSGEKIIDNGITFVAEAADLNQLDFANFDLLDDHELYRDYFRLPMFWMNNSSKKDNLKLKIGAQRLFPLFIGRGCPVNCTFCGGSRDAQKKLCNRTKPVFRSVSSVIDTIKNALAHGYNGFILCFDPTPQDDKYYLELMSEIRKQKIKCGFSFECWGLPTKTFINAFKETFDMKDSYIAISAETGSDEIRKKNKGYGYTNKQFFDILDHMKVKEVPVVIYMTMGMSGETKEHLQQTKDFTKKIRKEYRKIHSGTYLIPVQIEPASPIFENPEKYNIISNRSCFMDFYNIHGRTDSGPFTELGYTVKTLSNDIKEFSDLILNERCKNYCFIGPKIFGREVRFLSKVMCKLACARWKKRGFGAPAKNRLTFK
jgi:radical SAM superfamily enzyme YgiQ (UPF0313 family)